MSFSAAQRAVADGAGNGCAASFSLLQSCWSQFHHAFAPLEIEVHLFLEPSWKSAKTVNC